MSNTKFIKLYLPAILWSAFVFLLCLIPGNELPQKTWLNKIYFDKIVHIGMYFVLFLLIVRIRNQKNIPQKNIVTAAVICITQGVFIELLQGSIISLNRSFDVFDIMANCIGVLFAIILLWRKNLLFCVY